MIVVILKRIYPYLPEYTDDDEGYSNGTYLGGDRSKLVKGQNIEFSDGTTGTVFIIMEVDNWIPELKVMIIELLITVVAVLVVTAGVFIYWDLSFHIKTHEYVKGCCEKYQRR